ncbi:MAG: nucleotidyltransferase family protein [bacterium]|nr:nucleotidyltransferase family protein [bacterium]
MSFEEIRKKITPILKNRGAEYAAVFGSAARGEAKPGSDVDVLVRFGGDISLLDHIGIAYELGDTIGRNVDLITEQSLSKHVAPNVKKDLKVLYGTGQRQDLL